MTAIGQSNLRFTFPKSERLHSKKLIEELFTEGSYFYLYPFRVTYLKRADELQHPQAMFSVSKRKFKSAVSRNRIKRQLKEGYRLNKHKIKSLPVLLAFVYTADKKHETAFLEKKICKALDKLISIS